MGDLAKRALRITEFAAITGISKSLTHKLIQQGKIRAIRLGQRRLVIPVEEVDKLLAGGN